ncbi:MAG TPA: serine/threonine-protein kinase, partial [Kofleriaceae bacterium]|nr:serine/threonine-protein kinase [Kofleriaceae bacterium]
MTTPTREELELYVMGEYDGDPAALEGGLAADGVDAAAARAFLADEARFEALLQEAGAAATFCPGCGDLVRGARCDACGAATAPGGYTVERVLVSNAHGRMYVARDADGKQVALKELAFVQSPSLEVVAAFEREAKFLRALDHPAIPRFVASFEEGEGVHTRYYLAQELVAGPSLAALLDDHWFTEAEIRDVARQVLRVLVYLQSLSPRVIHRDIKPANLLRRADGSIAVVDFGAAHVQGTTAGSTSIGTFGYMPIEQLAGQVDATTDPFALGASLLHLLSRQEPWRIVQGRRLESINVSPALRGFLARLVEPEPADRYPNAAAALAALEALDGGDIALVAAGVSSGGPDRPVRGQRGWLRPLVYAAAAAACLATGVGGYAIASWRAASHHDDGPSAPRPLPGFPMPGVAWPSAGLPAPAP